MPPDHRRSDPRVADELRFHRDRLIEDYMAAGLDREAAERRAFHEFGNVASLEEQVRDVRGRLWQDFAQDVRYALRAWRRSPGFVAVAVMSLALGIGANAAIFSIVNATLLRALPVADPGRLVVVGRGRDARPGSVSNPLFERLRDHVPSFAGAFAFATAEQTIAIGGGEDELVAVDMVSGGYFAVLGLEPAAGRLLGPADDTLSAAAPAAVISDRFWQRRFGRSLAALGQTFSVRERTFTIVGVTPAGFRSARPDRAPDIMLPLQLTLGAQQLRSADFNSLRMMARLARGVTVERADAEVQTLFKAFTDEQAAQAPAKAREGILRQQILVLRAPDGVNVLRYEYRRSLLTLMGIVALVLLLACVNLSGLLLARTATRQREISIRLAIGAGYGRLVRQFLTESLVLAIAGGAAGLAAAWWLTGALFALILNGRDVAVVATPDSRALLFTMGASLLACAVMGLTPSWQAVRSRINPALKDGGRNPRRLGRTLVVAQIAISMVLVVGATLFIGTLVALNRVDRGFDAGQVLSVNVRSATRYPAERVRDVEAALVARLKQLPGVRTVSAAQMLPVSGSLWDRSVQVEGYQFKADESETVGFNVVAPDYFAVMSTPLLAGREFDARDTGGSPPAAIVNERFARDFFGGVQAALGRRVTSVRVTYEIVGVVRDARYQNLRDDVIRTMYIPWTQREGDQPPAYTYLLRVDRGDPRQLAPALDRAVREADPALRLRQARAYAAIVDENIGAERTLAVFGGFFGLLALAIAAIGVFGVLAFQIARRTNEIGIRMALGARRRSMIGLVLRDVAMMVLPGVVIGGSAALLTAGVARQALFGVTATDPRAFAVAAVVLTGAALVAAWLPARRAANVDPLVALRHE